MHTVINSIEKNRNKNRNMFYSYIVYLNMWVLSFKVVLGYQGLLHSQTTCDFLYRFFFSIRPTDPISGNAFDAKREKNRDGLIYKGDILFRNFVISTRTCRLWTSQFRVFLKLDSLQVYAKGFIREFAKCKRVSFSFPELRYSLLEFNSRKELPTPCELNMRRFSLHIRTFLF